MNKKLYGVILAAIVLSVLSAASASAISSILMDSRSDFLSWLGGAAYSSSFDVVDGYPVAKAPVYETGSESFQAWVSSTGGPAFIAPDYGLGGGVQGNQVLTGSSIQPGGDPVADWYEPVHVTFAKGMFAFGFDDIGLTPEGTEAAHVVIRYADNSADEMFSFQDNDGKVFTPTFWGIVSSKPIIGFSVFSTKSLTSSIAQANAIDNLIATRDVFVPEPSAVAGLAVGIAGIAFSGFRRRIGK